MAHAHALARCLRRSSIPCGVRSPTARAGTARAGRASVGWTRADRARGARRGRRRAKGGTDGFPARAPASQTRRARGSTRTARFPAWEDRCAGSDPSAGSTGTRGSRRGPGVRRSWSTRMWSLAACPTGFIQSRRAPGPRVPGARACRRDGRGPGARRGGTPTSVPRRRDENSSAGNAEYDSGMEKKIVYLQFGRFSSARRRSSVVPSLLPDSGVPRGHLEV